MRFANLIARDMGLSDSYLANTNAMAQRATTKQCFNSAGQPKTIVKLLSSLLSTSTSVSPASKKVRR